MADLYGFIRWLLAATALRQDERGARLSRGKRRIRQGKRVVIYSRQAFEGTVSDDWCGITWQDGKRGRDNDQLWRIALAVTLLEQSRLSRVKACYELILNHSISVVPIVTRRTDLFKLSNDQYQDAERLRVRVTRYIRRAKEKGVNFERDLVWMQGVYQWVRLEIKIERG